MHEYNNYNAKCNQYHYKLSYTILGKCKTLLGINQPMLNKLI